MSIFTSRTAITAGAIGVAIVLSVGGVAVAQASIGQFDDTTPTGIPTPTATLSDDGPLHDLNDDHDGLRPDGVSDDGPLHDLNDDHDGLGEDESDDDGDDSGHGDGVDNSGHGNAEDGDHSGSGDDNSGHGNSDN